MYEKNTYYYENYKIIDTKEIIYKNKPTLQLNIKSEVSRAICPNCGKICDKDSNNKIGTYYRNIEDTPYNFQAIWLNIHVHKFICTNEKCSTKYFDEVLPFARKNKVKTDNFLQFILTLSIAMSSTTTSLILSILGTSVSADVIDNILKKIDIKDDVNIEGIGVDDVAIRKGRTYATAIYDLNDHHLIALLEGRDSKAFKEWLENHKKIKIVARDRATAYAKAINDVLPDCIQVADRYHLFANLLEALKDIFYLEVPEKIYIKDGKIIEEPIKITKQERTIIDREILEQFDYDNTVPKDEYGNEIKVNKKVRDLDSKQYKEQAENRLKKRELIIKVKKRCKEQGDYEKIAAEFSISVPSVIKYKYMTDDQINQLCFINEFTKAKSKMDNYCNMIYKMLKDNIHPTYIYSYVKSKGCNATDGYISNYIHLIAKNNNLNYSCRKKQQKKKRLEGVTIITRYELLKYLLTLNSKTSKDKVIEKNIQIIFEKYPIAEKIQQIFSEFHDVIFSKNPENIDIFIEKYTTIIPKFCYGIKKDIAPIKNAISYKINSGFVEGNNNKFKLIKRIVYGKLNLCNLFKKSYLSFLSTSDGFDISSIMEGILKK